MATSTENGVGYTVNIATVNMENFDIDFHVVFIQHKFLLLHLHISQCVITCTKVIFS